MKLLTNLRIAPRLSILFAVLLIVVLIGLGVFAAGGIRSTIDTTLEANLRSQAELVGDLIDELSGKALQVSSVVAELDVVKDAYRVSDELAGRRQLASAMRPLVATLSEAAETPEFRIHFHKAPAVSFYRTWTDAAGDDLSGFRGSIKAVARTRES